MEFDVKLSTIVNKILRLLCKTKKIDGNQIGRWETINPQVSTAQKS